MLDLQLTIEGRAGAARVECRALLLDMDGTLVDSRICVERKWRAWCALHGLDADRLLTASHGLQLADTVRGAAPHLSVEDEVARLVEWEERDTAGLRTVPGARELLSALPTDRWAVVTSAWRRLATIRMRHTGLPIPPVMVTADDVERGKPAPDGYLAAAARLGQIPAACAVVEDSPAGIQAGRAAGMCVIGVATTFAAEHLDADWVIGDLTSIRVTLT